MQLVNENIVIINPHLSTKKRIAIFNSLISGHYLVFDTVRTAIRLGKSLYPTPGDKWGHRSTGAVGKSGRQI